MSEYSDTEILKMLRSSSDSLRSKALRYIYDKLYPYIAGFIIKQGGLDSDIPDVFQNSLIAFYEKARNEDFELSGSIKNYVHGICRNLWFKRFRKENKEISVEDVSRYESAEEEVNEVEQNRLQQLDKYFLSLGASCQEILKLYYYKKMNMNQIAEVLSLANGSVAKNKKARCMQKLKSLFLA